MGPSNTGQQLDLDKIIAACPGEMLEAMHKIGEVILEEQKVMAGERAEKMKTFVGRTALRIETRIETMKESFGAFVKYVIKSFGGKGHGVQQGINQKVDKQTQNLRALAEEFNRISKGSSVGIAGPEPTPALGTSKSRSSSIDSTSSITTTSSKSSKSSGFER